MLKGLRNMNKFKDSKQVERAIRYNADVDTYYVHFNIADLYTTKGFPTLEDAREFRDAVYKEKLELKKVEIHENRLQKERKLLSWRETDIYPENVIDAMGVDLRAISEDVADKITSYYVILADRTERCIVEHFQNHKTLEEISQMCGVTRERIRQIICKGLRKLKHHILRLDKENYNEECKKLYEESLLRQEKELSEYRQKLVEMFKEKGIYDVEAKITFGNVKVNNPIETPYEDLPIADLDLSVRTYNCCRRYHLNNVGDFKGLTMTDIMKIRNLGRKSAKELVEKLNRAGVYIDGQDKI